MIGLIAAYILIGSCTSGILARLAANKVEDKYVIDGEYLGLFIIGGAFWPLPILLLPAWAAFEATNYVIDRYNKRLLASKKTLELIAAEKEVEEMIKR